jgi:ATP-binding cassette, subfamily B, heavy metal transporter
MRPHQNSDLPINGFNWQVLKVIWPYLLEFKVRIFFALLCLILTKIASVYLPFILKDVVDVLDTNKDNSIILAPFGLVAAYGAARFATVIFAEIRDTLFGRVTERAIRRIGLKVFRHLHQLDLDFHLNRQTGGLSRDIDRGNSGVNFLMRFMVFNIVPTLLEIIMVITILFVNYGFWFAFVTLISIVSYVGYSFFATELRTKYVRAANKADSTSNTRAIDSLLNYETVKYFNNEGFEATAYDNNLSLWEKAKANNRLSLFALNGGQALIISLSMSAMLSLSVYQVSHGLMTLGDFVLINAFMMQLFIPLNFLGFVYREIKGSLANIENMFALLEQRPKVADLPNAKDLALREGVMEFDQVCFGYNQKRDIIKGLSFSIKSGQKVAVVGDSGSGKSTLVKLLFRFYDVSSGQVRIDGQAIHTVTQHSLRKHIGIVPQDSVLFNDTLIANVHYGNPSATKSEVLKAIELAHLNDFVASLPDGLETTVGERGLKLSGGEKQRVAIARTILKNPAILVFDEATSSLDSHAEQAILAAIKAVSAHKTSLVIAHRLSTVIDADNILVMQAGEIIEQGNHKALLAMKGYYSTMWKLQQSQP